MSNTEDPKQSRPEDPLMSSLDSAELGRKGEIEFQRVAEAAKYIVNKSHDNDSAGWDWVLNDRITLNPSSDLDRRPAPKTCVIQIKTKWIGNNQFDLKLSAAEQLAKDPKPSFILCLFVDRDSEEVSRSYLIHMLGANLEKVLKRLRQESINPSKKLNKSNIFFNPFQDGTEFELTKGGLRSALTEFCGSDPALYAQRKAKQLRELGWRRQSVAVNGTITSSEDNIIDFFLGNKSDLPTTINSITETRFGIPQELEGFPVQAKLEFKQAPYGSCDLVFRHRHQKYTTVHPGKLYLVPSELILRSRRPFRVSTIFFDVVAKENKINIKPNKSLVENSKLAVSDWLSFTKSLIILNAGSSLVELKFKGRKIFSVNLPDTEYLTDNAILEHRLDLLKALQDVLDYAGAGNSLQFKLPDLGETESQIWLLHESLLKKKDIGRISFDIETEAIVPAGAITTARINSYIKFDDQLLFWSAEMEMDARNGDNAIVFISRSVEVCDVSVIHQEEYEAHISNIKISGGYGVIMSKSGFGVDEAAVQTVQLDFVTDLIRPD